MADQNDFVRRRLLEGALVWAVAAYTWHGTQRVLRVPVLRDVLGLALGVAVGAGAGGLSDVLVALWRVLRLRARGQSAWDAVRKEVSQRQGGQEHTAVGGLEDTLLVIALPIVAACAWYETRKVFRVPLVRDVLGLASAVFAVAQVTRLEFARRRFWRQ